MSQRAYIRVTRVNGKVVEPAELIIEGMKVAELSRFEMIELLAQAVLSLRDYDA